MGAANGAGVEVLVDDAVRGARCEYHAHALDARSADGLLAELLAAPVAGGTGRAGAGAASGRVVWRTHVDDFGPQDRLTAYWGDAGTAFWFVGLRLEPEAWPLSPLLAAARAAAQRAAGDGVALTACLANRYDAGEGFIAPHGDEVRAHGPEPVICTLSLGGPREIVLMEREGCEGAAGERRQVRRRLEPGSVLVMRGRAMQDEWRHELPLASGGAGANPVRIALTFRSIVPGYEDSLAATTSAAGHA